LRADQFGLGEQGVGGVGRLRRILGRVWHVLRVLRSTIER
jgi:hypothetical protein